jgi:hypothetical protein
MERLTYSIFLGRMTKHQRVQMRPVQVRAKFWVKESFSAGRAKSEIPARTRDHYNQSVSTIMPSGLNLSALTNLHDRSPIILSVNESF